MATAGDSEIKETDVVSPPKKARRSIIRSLSWKRSKKNKMDENDDSQMDDPDLTRSYHEESGLDDSCQSTKKRKRFGVWRAMKRMFRRRNNKASKSFTEGVSNSPKSLPKRSLSDPNLVSSSYRPELAPLEQVENMSELNEEPSTSTTIKFAMSHDSLLSEMRSKGKVQKKEETVLIVHREPEELNWDVAPSSDALLPNLNISRDKIKIAPRQRRAPTRKQANSSGKDKKKVKKHAKEIKPVRGDSMSKKDISLSEVDGGKMAAPSKDNVEIEKELPVVHDDMEEKVEENFVVDKSKVEEKGDEENIEVDEKQNEYKLSLKESTTLTKEEKEEVKESNGGDTTARDMLMKEKEEFNSSPNKEDQTLVIDPMIFNVMATTGKKDPPTIDETKKVSERPKSASLEAEKDILKISEQSTAKEVTTSDDVTTKLASPDEKKVFPQMEIEISAETSDKSNVNAIEDDVKQPSESPVTASSSKRKSWRISSSSDPKVESIAQVDDVASPTPLSGGVVIEDDVKQPSESPVTASPSKRISWRISSSSDPKVDSIAQVDDVASPTPLSGGVVIEDDVKQPSESPVTASPSKRISWRISSSSDAKVGSLAQVEDVAETKLVQPVGKIAVEKKSSENAVQKRSVSSPELKQVTNKSSVSSEKDLEETNEIRPNSYHGGSQVNENGVVEEDCNIGVSKLKQAFERTHRAQTISYSERRKKPEVLPKPRAASERTKSVGNDYSKSLGRNFRVPTTTTNTGAESLNEKSSLSKPQQGEKQIVANKNSINASENADKKDAKPTVKPAVSSRPKPAPKPKISMVEEKPKGQPESGSAAANKEVVNGTSTSDDTTSEVSMSSFWARRHMFSTNESEGKSSPPSSPEKTKEVSKHAPVINLKTDSCAVCGSKVYQMEKFKVKDNIVHRSCIKCSVCKRLLSVGNFIMSKNKIYCKPHEPSMTILNI